MDAIITFIMAIIMTVVIGSGIATVFYAIWFVCAWFDYKEAPRIRFKYFLPLYRNFPQGWDLYSAYVRKRYLDTYKFTGKTFLDEKTKTFSFSFFDAIRYNLWYLKEQKRRKDEVKSIEDRRAMQWLIEQAKIDNARAEEANKKRFNEEKQLLEQIVARAKKSTSRDMQEIEKLFEHL